MKSLSAIVAAAFLILTVADMTAVVIVDFSGGGFLDLLFIYVLHFVLITLAVIFAAISALVSPHAPLTRVAFCGLTLLFGLFGLLVAPLFLLNYCLAPGDDVSFSLDMCMVIVAILNFLPIWLARRAALLYGAYGLVIALCLADAFLTSRVLDRGFLIGFPPPSTTPPPEHC